MWHRYRSCVVILLLDCKEKEYHYSWLHANHHHTGTYMFHLDQFPHSQQAHLVQGHDNHRFFLSLVSNEVRFVRKMRFIKCIYFCFTLAEQVFDLSNHRLNPIGLLVLVGNSGRDSFCRPLVTMPRAFKARVTVSPLTDRLSRDPAA